MLPPRVSFPRLLSAARMRYRHLHEGRRGFVRSRLRLSQPGDRYRRTRRRRAAVPAEVVARISRARSLTVTRPSRRFRQPASRAICSTSSTSTDSSAANAANGSSILCAPLEKPVVVTLHTVLPDPDETILRVTRELCASAAPKSSRSRKPAADCSKRVYGIDPERRRGHPSRRPRRAVPRYRRGKSRRSASASAP